MNAPEQKILDLCRIVDAHPQCSVNVADRLIEFWVKRRNLIIVPREVWEAITQLKAHGFCLHRVRREKE